MSRAVDRDEFWRARLEDAEKEGSLHLSVYKTDLSDWEYICEVHKKIADYHVTGKVLDMGCGYGRLSEWFDDYTGMDSSETFINKAKKLYPGKDFRVGDGQTTAFDNKEFDWVICVSLKGMVVRELGEGKWNQIEGELKRVAKKILILEYSKPFEYEIIE